MPWASTAETLVNVFEGAFGAPRRGRGLCLWMLFFTVLTWGEAPCLAAQETPAEKIPPERKAFSPEVYCGIYSLDAILQLAGRNVRLEELAVASYVDLEKESSIAQLQSAAHHWGMHTLAIEGMSTAMLKESPWPIILHVKKDSSSLHEDHYEVFLGTEDGRALLFDAPRPLRQESFPALSTRWSGTGLVVAPEPIDEAMFFQTARKTLWLALGAGSIGLGILYFLGRRRGSSAPGLTTRQFLNRSSAEVGAIAALGLLGGLLFNLGSEGGLLAQSEAIREIESTHLDSLLPKLDAESVASSLGTSRVVLIDARRPAAYQAGHIPGAINIPFNVDAQERAAALQGVPKTSRIIVYCQSLTCGYAETLAAELVKDAFSNLSLFPGGWVEWRQYRQGNE